MWPGAGAGFRQENTHTGSIELAIPPQKPKSLLQLAPFPGIRAENPEAAQAQREAKEQPLGISAPRGRGPPGRGCFGGSDFQDL